MLRVHGVSKTFAARRAEGNIDVLRDVSFDVATGECAAIIGPSGCGKTTLLRIIQGLERATNGTVSIDGAVVRQPTRCCAMVFQHFNLFPWLTAAENVRFGLDVAARPGMQSDERARDLIHLVGLEGFENRYPHELSGGMQQRVGLARALAVEPALLLLDEPFGAVDAITREQLHRDITQLIADGRRTAVFVTHSMDEAIFFADRILVMGTRPSRIVADVRVTAPRPRSTSALASDMTSARIREQLWSLLAGEGGRA